MYKKLKKLKSFINTEIQQCAVLVVGDIMLDKYYFGEVSRISPEAPVPVTRVLKTTETLGGAANVANNLALLGCKVYLAGVTGKDAHRESLLELLAQRQISSEGLINCDCPTITKLRIIGGHQQMLRLDFEETAPIAGQVEEQLKAYILKLVPHGVSAVIISDYAKGVCTPEFCQFIIKHCSTHKVEVIVDPKGVDWTKYSGADYITPNLKELNEAIGLSVANDDTKVTQAARRLKRKYHIKNMVVTRSEQGLSFIGRRCIHIPTHAQEVFDASGAGDTVIAVLVAALAAKVVPEEAAYLANMAAGVVVGKLGTYAINRSELLMEIVRKEAE